MQPVKASPMHRLANRFVDMNFRHRCSLVRTLCDYSPLLLKALRLYGPLHLRKGRERGTGVLIDVSDRISMTGELLR